MSWVGEPYPDEVNDSHGVLSDPAHLDRLAQRTPQWVERSTPRYRRRLLEHTTLNAEQRETWKSWEKSLRENAARMLQEADTVARNIRSSTRDDEELLQQLNSPIRISRVNHLILGGCFCQVRFDTVEEEEDYKCDCIPDPCPDCHRRLRNCYCGTDGCDTCYLQLQFPDRLCCKTCRKPTSLCVCGPGSCNICIHTHNVRHDVEDEPEYCSSNGGAEGESEGEDAGILEKDNGDMDVWAVE